MRASGTLLVAGLLCLGTVRPADAGSLTVAWDPSADRSVAGYVISYGTQSGKYAWNVDTGSQTQRLVSGLSDNTTYFFVVKSYTATGVVSSPSPEVSGRVSSTTTASSTTSATTSTSASSLTVAWDPSPDPSVSGYVISYGTQSGRYDGSVDAGLQTQRSVSGLSANTVYYFVVQAYTADHVLSLPSSETSGSTATTVVAPTNTPISSVRLTSNVAAPQNVGATIGWTATAIGGASPYTYQWWLTKAGTQTALTNWSSSSTYSWKPTIADSTYSVTACARSAWNTTNNPEGCVAVPFAVVQPPTVTLTTNLAAPQNVGTTIRFTATAAGGTAPYQYQWWVSDGSSTVPKTGWGTMNPFVWTPNTADRDYVITVWVRSAGNTVNAPEMTKSIAFPIQRKCQAAKCQFN
jgi:hypothetical protein